MMYQRFLVVLGIVLVSYVPAAAQQPAKQIAMVVEPSAPAIRAPRQTLPATPPVFSFSLLQEPTGPSFRLAFPTAKAYEPDRSLRSAFQIADTRTMFVTESRLPIAQFWGGRLKLEGFMSTLRMGNIVPGPSASREALRANAPYGATRSVDLYGVSLRIPFGRDEDSRGSTHLWRRLSRIVGGR